NGEFVVGDGGLGSLSIQSDGTVITTPGTVVGLAGAVIANQSGAAGSSVNIRLAGQMRSPCLGTQGNRVSGGTADETRLPITARREATLGSSARGQARRP